MNINQHHESQRLIPPVTEPADPHWLMLATHQHYMNQVKRDERDWYDRYDESDMLKASEAQALAKDAPSEYTAGLLIGHWLVLREIAALSERSTD